VGLLDIRVYPAFGAAFGKADPQVIEYARNIAAQSIADGSTTQAEAAAWLRELDDTSAKDEWFSADTMFVVVGTVP
jgi:hypothetical protein